MARAVFDKGQEVQSLGESIHGRYPAEPVVSPKTGEVLFDTDHMLMPDDAKVLEEHGIEEVKIRSVMTCEARSGVCAKCYGINLAIRSTPARRSASSPPSPSVSLARS